MPFKTQLTALLDGVPGALGAAIVDWEGEAVDQAALVGDFDIRILAAHGSIIFNLMREVQPCLPGEQLEQVAIRTSEKQILMVSLSADYLLVLQLQRQALMARAASRLATCAAELRHEFQF